MSWRVRHEGSPRSIEGLTAPEISQGLLDGQWEPTDEVMGPNDIEWMPIESHPTFSEIALDMEPPPARERDDETRLDMTPLIDVTMVLLIFFILTTGYAALQRMLEGPTTSNQNVNKPITISKTRAESIMIIVHVVQEANGDWGFRIEQDPVSRQLLSDKLAQFAASTKKTELLIDCPDEAPREMMIAVLDAANKAELKPHDLRQPKEQAKP
jgi:biopolymer transport protein ExbD